MDSLWSILGPEGFKFMGKMNASISHEIKNVFAIINEHAGLLEDLTLMAEKGAKIDPERLKGVAEKIKQNIQRADRIVLTMNTFAHSVDEAEKRIDVGEVVAFMATLAERPASLKGVEVSAIPSEVPVVITTNPFILENIIWKCLSFCFEKTGDDKNIRLAAEPSESGGAIIRCQGIKKLGGENSRPFPGEAERAMLSALKGQMEVNVEACEIVLLLPESIG